MPRYGGGAFLFTIMQIFNLFVFILGVGLLASALYLWLTVKLLNSFILSISLVGFFIIFTSGYGYFCTKNSPTLILCYELFLLVLTIFVLTLAFFILYDQPDIVNFLTKEMTDSAGTIATAKVALNSNMNVTKISLFVYSIVIVIIFIIYILYN